MELVYAVKIALSFLNNGSSAVDYKSCFTICALYQVCRAFGCVTQCNVFLCYAEQLCLRITS